MVALLVFMIATLKSNFWPKKLLDSKDPFGDNVLKNPARCKYVCLYVCMYVCMYVCICGLRIIYSQGSFAVLYRSVFSTGSGCS